MDQEEGKIGALQNVKRKNELNKPFFLFITFSNDLSFSETKNFEESFSFLKQFDNVTSFEIIQIILLYFPTYANSL